MSIRIGGRRDAALVKGADALHFVMGCIYPSRPDNEAYISTRIDLAPIKAYIAEKNRSETDFPYTFFHVIVAALTRTITLRPKLNRFFANKNYYQRHEVSASFVIKKQFNDQAEEGMAFVRVKPTDNIASVHEDIRRQVRGYRSDKTNSTDDSMDILNKLPRFIGKTAMRFLCFLDRHGWVPESLIHDDPNYSSILISNLGSIKLKSGYHHLSTWGTCSLFCIIGEKQWTPVYDQNGLVEMRETIDLGLTVDERIADGYYYAKSIRLFKHLIEHPELLEQPMNTEVDYE